MHSNLLNAIYFLAALMQWSEGKCGVCTWDMNPKLQFCLPISASLAGVRLEKAG